MTFVGGETWIETVVVENIYRQVFEWELKTNGNLVAVILWLGNQLIKRLLVLWKQN